MSGWGGPPVIPPARNPGPRTSESLANAHTPEWSIKFVSQSGATLIEAVFTEEQDARKILNEFADAQRKHSKRKDEHLLAPPLVFEALNGLMAIQPAAVAGALMGSFDQHADNHIRGEKFRLRVEREKKLVLGDPVGFGG